MGRILPSFLPVLLLLMVFLHPALSFGEDSKKKADNSAVLEVLPGPNGTVGIRSIVKKFGLTYVRIVIDHQTAQDPINVLIQFQLPHMKSCPLNTPPEHPADVEATWQAPPGADQFLPMNVWARSLSRGTFGVFEAAACQPS